MSGQFAIKTPFKLKRDAPNTLSTLDRTIPALKSSHPPPPPRGIVKMGPPMDNLPAITRHALPADTAELQREMGRLMGKDEQLSQRSTAHTKSGHSYTLHPLQSRLVLSLPHPIPSRVQHLYEELTAKENAPCSFKQGVLPAACVYYFAVGRWVLFYDIGRTVQLGGKLEEAFMHQCQFQSAVVEVRQLSIKHPIFGEFKNRSIILVATPWKLGFAALEIHGGDRLQTGPRWMRLTLLNTFLTIAAQQPSHFTEDPVDHRLYYLDEEGGINCVAFQSNNWLGKLMGNNSRYRLSQATAPSGINSKAFFTSRRATIWERLRHYSKVILAQATSFYGKINKNCDLVCDGRRRLLFSLVDTNYDPVNGKPSSYRLLTAWDTSKDKLTVKCQISEAELYQREIAGIANFPALANYRIVRLHAISPCIDLQAELMVVLQCGIRLYLSVDGGFRLVRHHLPPLLESNSANRRQPIEHNRTVQLTHCHLEGSSAIINLKQEGENHTFIIWRLNQEKQEEECAEVLWGSSMSSPSGNAPLENQLHRMQLSLAPQKKQQILKELASRSTKNPFSGANSLPHLHQLARDLLLPPSPYIHSTDADIEWLCEVRPIDWAFTAVQANMRDQRIFKRVLEGLPQEELTFLLVQLFCDPEGLYLKDLQLIDCLAHYERRVLQQGGTSFDAFHQEFRSRTHRATSSRKQQREIQPTYVGRDSIDAQMEGRLLDLLFRLAKHTEGKPKRDIEVQQTIANAVTLYLSRLLRFLWRRSVKKVNPKLQGLLAMIHPITRIIQHCRTPPTKPKSLPQQPQYKLENLVPTRKSKALPDPNIHETQPLQAVSRLVSRMTQLLSLCSKIDLRVDKTFAEALAMSSEQFEAPLFYFLTDKYDQPTSALQVFKQAFPSFVGEQLERSLRIEQESRGKTENEIVAILRYHKGVPTYLLRHLQGMGKIHPDSSRGIQSLSSVSSASKLSISSCNVREGVATLLRELRERQATLQQRALAVVQLKALLAHHLQTHQQEDRFYRDSRSELQEVQRRLTMQQLLISQYQARGEANVQVASELKTSLFQVEVLKELVGLLKVPRLKIIFTLLFVRLEEEEMQHRLEEEFREIIEADRRGSEQREEGLLKKAHSFIQDKLRLNRSSETSQWTHLQHTINSIIANTRSCLPLEQLLPILTGALLGHSAASPNISEKQIDDTLPALAQILGGNDKFVMRQEVHRLPLPILSAMLRQAGCDQADLQSYYQASLRRDSESGVIFDSKQALYQWIGLLCLSLDIQPRGEFFLFNSKRFFDNLIINSPQKRALMPHLRLLCKNYAILHRLETLHNELFPH